MRDVPGHPLHADLWAAKAKYTKEICKTKESHWKDWLDEANDNDIWTANRYISNPSGDGGKTRIPTLKVKTSDGNEQLVDSNKGKAKVLTGVFFPPPPEHLDIDPDFEYPRPVCKFQLITRATIRRNVDQLSPYKALGPDGIPNIVLMRCIDILIDFLFHLYRALFSLDTYYDPWHEFTTAVLHKPGKP